MLLDPKEVHHFEDIGYMHDKLWVCPNNAPGEESSAPGNPGREGGVGCRCTCPDGPRTWTNHPEHCIMKMKEPNTRERPWLPRIL